jgi:hypothetical protein
LFQQIMQLKLDGMSFNCSGPAPALAFTQPFAGVVLQS